MQNTRKMNQQERRRYAKKLRGMETEIKALVSAYIKALENGDDDRFVATAELAAEARKDMGIELAKVKRFATAGIKLA